MKAKLVGVTGQKRIKQKKSITLRPVLSNSIEATSKKSKHVSP